MKSCFFIGHSQVPADIFSVLENAVERHIAEFEVKEFVVGHYGEFDRMAARAVISAKKRHPEIILSMLIPYHPAERPVELPMGFDNSFYPPGMEKVPRRLAIIRANRYMAEHVDYLIAYTWKPTGNSRNILEHAIQKNVVVTNIASLCANVPSQ